MKDLKDYKKEQLIKSHEATKKRVEKRRKKLNIKPKTENKNDYEASLAKRVEAGDKNAIRSWQRLKMLRKQRKK